MHIRVARNSFHVAECLLHRLAERDADILRRVVVINVQVTFCLHSDINARMTGKQVEHVIEEPNAGCNGSAPGPVEINRNLDVGFLGLALYGALAHGKYLLFARLLSGVRRIRHSRRECLQMSKAVPRCRGSRGFNLMLPNELPAWHGTTILTVRKGGSVVIGGDGQVSIGQTIVKSNAKKVRRLGKGDVIGGFAGATADAFTLFERLEGKLEQYPGQLTRAAVELAKDWRTDRYLRRLEAMMIVADAKVSLVLTGTGDVLEPENGVMGIGSGGNYALASARALLDGPLDAEAIVRKSLDIAAEICVFTKDRKSTRLNSSHLGTSYAVFCLKKKNRRERRHRGRGREDAVRLARPARRRAGGEQGLQGQQRRLATRPLGRHQRGARLRRSAPLPHRRPDRDAQGHRRVGDGASQGLPRPPHHPFFFNDTAPTEIYTLSLHDALPI